MRKSQKRQLLNLKRVIGFFLILTFIAMIVMCIVITKETMSELRQVQTQLNWAVQTNDRLLKELAPKDKPAPIITPGILL